AEASILYSDNDSYEALASPYMDDRFITWLHEHGIDYDEWSPWYPTANAAGMASCWTDIYRYLRSGESDAPWLEEMHANTNVSFVRDALEGQDVRVLNKAGWLADDEYNAVADCGIIETQGRSYLIAVLSSQPSYGEAHERVKELVRALFDSRDSLSSRLFNLARPLACSSAGPVMRSRNPCRTFVLESSPSLCPTAMPPCEA
ncbi:MAG: serine hydrolase, partial [Eggerthellaceae bacterium]|nr:serine hydrolase [Eggerthellaceae bacterium]